MKKTTTAAAAWAFLLTAGAAFGAPRLERGTRELAVHVSLDFEGAVGDTLAADAGFGWFVRDGLELRGIVSYAVLEDVAARDSDYRTQEVGAVVEYHVGRQHRAVPYLGVELGWRSTQFDDVQKSGLVYGPKAGLKYFLADNVALDFEITYRLASADLFVNDFVVEDSDLATAIGLRVLF